MFILYSSYSPASGKTYVGYTADVKRRLTGHNLTESRGFTLCYRPWILIHTEDFASKQEVMLQEKFYK